VTEYLERRFEPRTRRLYSLFTLVTLLFIDMAGALGRLKWSSQHSEVGGCDENSEAAISTVRTSTIAITWTATCCGTR
jgi:hypothetical protein